MKNNKQYINQIVEYIRLAGVWFDAADVEEDVEGVLCQCGYWESFPEGDLAILKREILKLGLERELVEITRAVIRESAGPAWMAREAAPDGGAA